MATVILVEVSPWTPGTRVATPIRLAGGGSRRGYTHRGYNDWLAGVLAVPRFTAMLGFDENGWTGGAIPQTAAVNFAPSNPAVLSALSEYVWAGAQIEIRTGDDALVNPEWTLELKGTVAGLAIKGGVMSLTVSDLSGALADTFLSARFAGTGGIEGTSDAKDRIKRRSLGRCFNVEGRLLHKAKNIWEFGDPAFPLQDLPVIKDRGRAYDPVVTVPWQGSKEATFAALDAAAAPDGGVAKAPSIACVKPWTVPAGPLTADILGEIGAGYVETAAEIAQRLVSTKSGMVITNVAEAKALRGGAAGIHVDNETDTAGQLLDRLLFGVSLVWVLDSDGAIRLSQATYANPVAVIEAIDVEREATYKAVSARLLGYQRNHRLHTDAEISAVFQASDGTYADGTPIEDLKPAQPGADVTGDNTSADTAHVDGVPSQELVEDVNETVIAVGSLQVQISDIVVQVDDLVETYGDTVAAAISADAAQAAANNAEAAREASVAARTAAEQAEADALAAATAAAGSASAASGSASTATTKATEAGQSATAAQGSATAANTSAGAASTSAGNAATSATNASGSASSASTSATTAATAADNSAKAIAAAYPEVIARGAVTTSYNTFEPAALEPLALFSSDGRTVEADTTVAGVYPYALWLRAPIALVPGRRYRVVAVAKKISGSAANYISPRVELFNAAKTWTASVGGTGQTPAGRTLLDGSTQQLAWEFTSDGYAAGTSWIRVGIEYNRTNTGAVVAGAADVEITALYVRDITESAAAAGSASAAATSASSASGSATTAGQQATAAQTSATNANTSAGNASTSAGQASTSATNAAGSASAASTSAGVAANYVGAARQYSGDTYWTNGLDGYEASPGQGNAPNGTIVVGGAATVGDRQFRSTAGANVQITSRKWFAIDPTRRYRARARVRAGTATATQIYIGVDCQDAAGVHLDHGGFGTFRYSIMQGEVHTAADGWLEPQVIMTGEGNDGWLKFAPGTRRVQLVALLNWTAAAGAYADLNYMEIVDVEEELRAAASASAAATSASSASTSSGAAGTSATAAQTSATNANTSAGNASSSATAASGSASSASSSASAALQSMQLAAVVGQRAINGNPTFADWPSAASMPIGWAQWGTGTPTKQAGLSPSPNSIGLNTSGGSVAMGVTQWMPAVKPGRYIIEVDFEIVSGTMNNLGIMWRGYNAANANITGPDFALWNMPDVDGIVWGTGGTYAGRMYRFRVLVDEVATSALTNAYVYFSTDQYFSGAATPKNVKLHRLAVIPADERDQLPAEVKALAGAVASAGRQTAFLQQTTSVAGGAGTAVLAMRADVSAPSSAPVTPYLTGTGSMKGTTFVGRRALRNSGPNDWSYGLYSVESYSAAAYAAVLASQTTTARMFGISDAAPESNSTHYSNIDYGIYLTGNSAAPIQVYESGTPTNISGVPVAATDFFEVEYLAADGGTINYKRNGTAFLSRTGVGAARTFRLLLSMFSLGGWFDDVVFSAAGPSTTSSITLLAKEIALGNTDEGGNAKIALKIANGDAAFSGNIYAGGKIIQGNGNTGWEVAVKPKIFVVADGQAVTWSNLGYVPSYSFDGIGLAPLSTGETYALSLTSLSATGATVSLKINVPGTPANQSVGPGAAGGAGNPTMVVSKAGKPDATNNAYRFQGTATAYADAYRDYPVWYADIYLELTFYAKVGGTWTAVGYYSDAFTYYDTVGGVKGNTFGFDTTVTIPAGATDFGLGVGGSAASGSPPNGNISTVTWQSPGTAGSVRTASPQGQTCKLTVTP